MEEYPHVEAEMDMLDEDNLADQMERQQDVQTEVYGDSAPSYSGKDDLFSLFWKVIKLRDSSKTANLDKQELGYLNWNVRDCQQIALLGHTLGHNEFGSFWASMGEITLATSSSKKGWLQELFVSQKKASMRAREIKQEQLQGGQQPKKKKKWGLR